MKSEERAELELILRRLPNFTNGKEFDAIISKLDIRNPANKKTVLSEAFTFNLMFDTKVGPLGDQKAYLRPETA